MKWAEKNINILSGIKDVKQLNLEKKLYNSVKNLKTLKIEIRDLLEALEFIYAM